MAGATAAERLGAMAAAAIAAPPSVAPAPAGGYADGTSAPVAPAPDEKEKEKAPVEKAPAKTGMLLADLDDALEGLGTGPRQSLYRSSLDVPFFVVSATQLVEGVPALQDDEHEELLSWLDEIADALEQECAVLLADFEGEMTGFGGELVTAAFLPTAVLNRTDFSIRRDGAKGQLRAGLLLDLRCFGGRALCRRLMESQNVVKIIWGADGDLTSLRHQVFPAPLETYSRSVVDAQLAFSQPHMRLGMGRMLDRVPKEYKASLPNKASVEFDMPHSLNMRALRWPLQENEAKYAADDLHRLEAILITQVPPQDGGYAHAFVLTADIMARLDNDPYGLAWLSNELNFFSRKPAGTQRRAKAVQLVRHLKTLPARMAGHQFYQDFQWVAQLEAQLVHELATAGVVIPADASFAN